MRLSVLDIGTNTVLHLIADVDKTGSLTTVHQGHAMPRLGMGVDEHRTLSPDSMARVLSCLKDYVREAREFQAEKIIACGTSALRDASNSAEFIGMVKAEIGVNVSVLTGEEEAELTYIGAVSEFAADAIDRRFGVVDIGGGSTELTNGTGTTVESRQSFDIGSVRLTERLLKTSPPTTQAIEECIRSIRSHLNPVPLPSSTTLVGVAGTLTTLASIDLNLEVYDPLKVGGHRLTLKSVESIFHRLKLMKLEELRAMPQILSGRADILLAGILILIEVLKAAGAAEITVSDRGLRYGIAVRRGIPLMGRASA